VRLVHWNILHGGGTRRTPAIALRLLELRPDVVAITEFRAAAGGGLRAVLADHGLTHQVTTAPPAGRNGILLASRWRVEPGERPPHEGMALRWLDARLPCRGLRVTAVHIPDAARHDAGALSRKALFWRTLVESARAGLSAPNADDGGEARVVLGDFNSGRHRQDEAGATLTCTALLGELATLGYRDAWRLIRGRERAESWRSHAGAGFRLDHAFVSPALSGRVRGASYEDSAGLSDHAAMTVDLAPDGGPGAGAGAARAEIA
jgi:exonuclease III